MVINPFLSNLEDEISVKGEGFVKPKTCIKNKNNNNKINIWRDKIVNSDISNYTWVLKKMRNEFRKPRIILEKK